MQYMIPKISALNRTNCNFGTKCLELLKKNSTFYDTHDTRISRLEYMR